MAGLKGERIDLIMQKARQNATEGEGVLVNVLPIAEVDGMEYGQWGTDPLLRRPGAVGGRSHKLVP
jgi:hypothetical protein